MTLRLSLITQSGHELPGVEVAYIEMTVTAALDASGRYRYIGDSVVSTDGSSFVLSKPFESVVGVGGDAVFLDVDKSAADSIGVTDEIGRVLIFIRDLADSQSVTEHAALSFSKSQLETLAVVDSKLIEFSKNLADGFAMNDGAEAFDGSVYSLSKGISNVAVVGDAAAMISSKFAAESVGVADSGVLSMQDYCDITYFLEGYVGISTVF